MLQEKIQKKKRLETGTKREKRTVLRASTGLNFLDWPDAFTDSAFSTSDTDNTYIAHNNYS